MKRGIFAVVFILVLFAITSWGSAKQFEIKLQCVYPEKAYVGQTTKFIQERVEALTNGNVKIKIFWPDQLVKTNEALDALQKGMIDGYTGSLLYFSGVVPEVNCEWIPFAWENPHEVTILYKEHGWLELMRKATDKHGVYYVSPISVASMGLLTKFPVKKMEDIKGKKIRAVGMEAKIIEALGGAPVSIPGAEQYMALKLGVVDGTDYPFYTIGNYKFYEVVSHIIRPALHSPGIVEFLLNKKLYQELPKEYQEAINKAGWEAWLRTAELSVKWDEEAYELCRQKNVTIIDLEPKEVERFRTATLPLWDSLARDSNISQQMVENLKNYLKSKGIKLQ